MVACIVAMAVTSANEVGGGGGGAVASAHVALERAEQPDGDPRCCCSWCCVVGESLREGTEAGDVGVRGGGRDEALGAPRG
jgi:hypothetical protein